MCVCTVLTRKVFDVRYQEVAIEVQAKHALPFFIEGSDDVAKEVRMIWVEAMDGHMMR